MASDMLKHKVKSNRRDDRNRKRREEIYIVAAKHIFESAHRNTLQNVDAEDMAAEETQYRASEADPGCNHNDKQSKADGVQAIENLTDFAGHHKGSDERGGHRGQYNTIALFQQVIYPLPVKTEPHSRRETKNCIIPDGRLCQVKNKCRGKREKGKDKQRRQLLQPVFSGKPDKGDKDQKIEYKGYKHKPVGVTNGFPAN